MKKAILLTVLLAFVFTLPAAALAELTNASEFCAANDDLGFRNHGQCVSSITSCYGPGGEGAGCACKQFMSNDPTGFYTEYNNLDECINHLQYGFVKE